MQLKSGIVVRFLSGFCALFAVAAVVVLQRGRRRGRSRGKRPRERRRRGSKRPNMELYQRIEKPKEETRISDNEVRITTQGRMRNYITYATTLLMEKGSNEVVLKAMGRAINKTVMIAELIKRRIVGLHQNTSIGSTDITDTWEPLEEGLAPVETTRHVSMITITLSKKELNPFSSGYQPPLPEDQVKQMDDFDNGEEFLNLRSRGQGGGSSLTGGRPRGNMNGIEEYMGGGPRGYGGRGRGGRRRGRNFRGRGRGPAQYYDHHGDPEASLALGRGRGGGRGQGRGRIRGGRPAHAAAA